MDGNLNWRDSTVIDHEQQLTIVPDVIAEDSMPTTSIAEASPTSDHVKDLQIVEVGKDIAREAPSSRRNIIVSKNDDLSQSKIAEFLGYMTPRSTKMKLSFFNINPFIQKRPLHYPRIGLWKLSL